MPVVHTPVYGIVNKQAHRLIRPTLPALPGFHLENFIRGGSSVIIMKGGHDQMKSKCGFYSKLEYCEGVVEEFGED